MRFCLCFLFIFGSLVGQDCPTILKTPEEAKTFGELRVKTIKGWDKLISWALQPQLRPYAYETPLEKITYKTKPGPLSNFVEHYGYFSIYHPIVGMVTESERDIKVTNCLLSEIGSELNDRDQLKFTEDEILAKVMAYRTLKKGMKVTVPVSKSLSQNYIVDEVIDLWHGMPAFGLVPERKNGVAPILLFRGTDLDLTTEKGWASVLSDLDTSGPGHVTYLRARFSIEKWLKKVKETHEPARVVGFSLGGVFVLYTMLYEGEYLNKNIHSVAFNPPGVSKENLEEWNSQPLDSHPPHIIYVNQGDFVSTIGYFFDNTWELSLPDPMGVIQAHTTLISAQPTYSLTAIDVAKVNEER